MTPAVKNKSTTTVGLDTLFQNREEPARLTVRTSVVFAPFERVRRYVCVADKLRLRSKKRRKFLKYELLFKGVKISDFSRPPSPIFIQFEENDAISRPISIYVISKI